MNRFVSNYLKAEFPEANLTAKRHHDNSAILPLCFSTNAYL